MIKLMDVNFLWGENYDIKQLFIDSLNRQGLFIKDYPELYLSHKKIPVY